MDNNEREIRTNYYRFIENIKKDIPNIKTERKNENAKIRSILGIEEDIFKNIKEKKYEENVQTLIYHTKRIEECIETVSNDETLLNKFRQKISALIMFEQLSNLDNKVAINIYGEIINVLEEMISKKDEIVAHRDELNEELEEIENLRQLAPAKLERIRKLCQKHSIDDSTAIGIIVYLIKENAKIPVPIRRKEKLVESQDKIVEDAKISEEINEQDSIIVEDNQIKEKIQKLKEEFEILKKEKEEKISLKENNDLFEKYYGKLEKMNPIKKKICHANVDKKMDKVIFISNFIETYSASELAEMWAGILAFRLFNAKNELDRDISEVYRKLSGSITHEEDLEFCEDYLDCIKTEVNEYGKLIDELRNFDSKISKDPIEHLSDEQLAFFAHDITDYIEDDIKQNEALKKKLSNRINNIIASADKKGDQSIILIKGLEGFVFPKVFAFNDHGDVNLAYIRINKSSDGQPRIFIITAVNGRDSVDNLCKKCNELLKTNRQLFIEQYKKIEDGDIQELGLQKNIYDNIFDDTKVIGAK